MGLGTYLIGEHSNKSHVIVHRTQPWYEAYMEALFEHDPWRMPGAISTAVNLITKRQSEVIVGPSTALERRALKEALDVLEALQMLQH